MLSPVPASRPGQRSAADLMVLAGAGAAVLAFDVVHGAGRGLSLPLAVLYGLVLTGLAVGSGSIAWSGRGERATRLAAAAAMLGAVSLSASAAAAVVAPAVPGMLHLLFAAALASFLLAALRTVLAPPGGRDRPSVFAVVAVIPVAPGGQDRDSSPVPAGTRLPRR
jgi:hypothetical protein